MTRLLKINVNLVNVIIYVVSWNVDIRDLYVISKLHGFKSIIGLIYCLLGTIN